VPIVLSLFAIAAASAQIPAQESVVANPDWARELTTPDTRPADLSRLKGKPILVDVWSTACGRCIDALPMMQQLDREARKSGDFNVLMVHSGPTSGQWPVAEEMLFAEGYDFNLVLDPTRSTQEMLNLIPVAMIMPNYVLIDEEGRIMKRWSKLNARTMKEIRKQIDALNAG
jgi:thiol-disulfide isomerase/thioredoxin